MPRPQPTCSLSGALGVESVGVGEAPRIPVGRAVHQIDGRAARDGGAGDVDVGQRRSSREELHRRLQPKHLLDGPRNQLRPAAQQLDRPGVAQHGEHAMRDQIDRRVMAGEEQQDGVVDDRARRHLPVRAVIVDQLRNHPGPWGFPGFLDQPDDVLVELDVGGFAFGAPGLALLGLDVGAEIEDAGRDVGDPRVEPGLVFDRHAHDLADHVDRQRIGELVDDVHAGFARRFIEQAR